MAKFKCKQGHEWTVREIDNTDREAILKMCGVDILDEMDSGRLQTQQSNQALANLISTDVWLKPLSYLLANQLKERGMTASEIKLSASLIDAAREAVLDEFQAFFRALSIRRSLLFQELRKQGAEEIDRRLIAMTVGKLSTVDLSPLNSSISELVDAAIDAAAKTQPTSNAASTS